MRRFTDYIQTEAKDGLAPGGLGDWYDYGHGRPPGASRFTPPQLSATATWALCALTVSRAAEALGRTDEARQYRQLHTRIAADFQRHFRDPATGKLKHRGSPQCANAMALCAEIAPQADRVALVDEIVADLERRGYQQTPGDVGHVYFLRALAEAGRSDVLHRVYARNGLGSYGGILGKGLTALPETWDAMMDGSQSLNHCMLGHVLEWYYGYVAGVRQKPGGTGWTQVVIGPIPGPLTHVEARLKTPRGGILSRWKVQDGKFHLEVEIPQGVSATALLPSGVTRPLQSGFQAITEAWRSIDVPPGKYRVWLLCGRSSGGRNDYHAFDVAVGNARTTVKIPGSYRFEKRVLETQVTAGPLAIEFTPKSDWLVAGLAVYPVDEEAALRRDVLDALEREIHFLPPDVAAKWQETKHVDDHTLPEFSAADRRRGYAVFNRHWSEIVYPNTVPRQHELNPSLAIDRVPK